MGARFELVNFTLRERVSFSTLGCDKAREIVGSHPISALAIWYLIKHRGDRIALVSDYDQSLVFDMDPSEALRDFRDGTERAIQSAVRAGVLLDLGTEQLFPEDPQCTIHLLAVSSTKGGLPPDGLHDAR